MGRAVAPVRCKCDVTFLEYGYQNGGRQLLRHGGRGSTGGFNSRRPSYALGARLGTGTMSAYSRHLAFELPRSSSTLRKLRARNRRGVEEIGLGVCESAISPFQAAVDSRENRCDREHLERTTHREVSRANTPKRPPLRDSICARTEAQSPTAKTPLAGVAMTCSCAVPATISRYSEIGVKPRSHQRQTKRANVSDAFTPWTNA